MGYERYIQNTDPRGDYDVHDDLGQLRYRGPRASDWDRGNRYSSAERYALENEGTRRRGITSDRYREPSRGDGYYRGSYASDGHRFAESDRDEVACPPATVHLFERVHPHARQRIRGTEHRLGRPVGRQLRQHPPERF